MKLSFNPNSGSNDGGGLSKEALEKLDKIFNDGVGKLRIVIGLSNEKEDIILSAEPNTLVDVTRIPKKTE